MRLPSKPPDGTLENGEDRKLGASCLLPQLKRKATKNVNAATRTHRPRASLRTASNGGVCRAPAEGCGRSLSLAPGLRVASHPQRGSGYVSPPPVRGHFLRLCPRVPHAPWLPLTAPAADRSLGLPRRLPAAHPHSHHAGRAPLSVPGNILAAGHPPCTAVQAGRG